MRRWGEYSTIIKEYARFWPLGERLAVFWYNDIRTRPAALLRKIRVFLRLDPEWEPHDLHSVVAPSPEETVIGARRGRSSRILRAVRSIAPHRCSESPLYLDLDGWERLFAFCARTDIRGTGNVLLQMGLRAIL